MLLHIAKESIARFRPPQWDEDPFSWFLLELTKALLVVGLARLANS
jgi:hypothetical protein